MRARRVSGRLIGLLAAYLVAVQAMVLPLSMPPTPAFAGSLCLGGQRGGPAQQPINHGHGCPCCAGCGLQCHVPVLAGGLPTLLPVPQLRVAAVLVPAPLRSASRPTIRTPHNQRGPPAA